MACPRRVGSEETFGHSRSCFGGHPWALVGNSDDGHSVGRIEADQDGTGGVDNCVAHHICEHLSQCVGVPRYGHRPSAADDFDGAFDARQAPLAGIIGAVTTGVRVAAQRVAVVGVGPVHGAVRSRCQRYAGVLGGVVDNRG